MAVRWVLLLLLACGSAAEARMYQWVDPDTQTTQLSGKPPTWYRSAEGGPRVLVFEQGRMVDDTATRVSEVERERLRQEALVRAEQDQAAIQAKLAEAKRLQALLGQDEVPVPTPAPTVAPETKAELPVAEAAGESSPSVEAMRALVEKWDELRAASARMLLDKTAE
jgi:hypothetical protein